MLEFTSRGLIIFAIIFSFQLSYAQTYSYQVIDDGCTKDTVQVMKWPDSVPSQFHNLLCFDEVRKMRIHSREINLELPNQMVKTDQFTQWDWPIWHRQNSICLMHVE